MNKYDQNFQRTSQIQKFSQNTGRYAPEITLYLDTFHAVINCQTIYMSNIILKGNKPLINKLPEPNESSKYVSYKAKISEELNLRKDSEPTKFKQTPQVLVKLSFRELYDSKLSGLHILDIIIHIFHWAKKVVKP